MSLVGQVSALATRIGTEVKAKANDTGVVHKAGGDTITASAAGVVPLVLKGTTGQTANRQEWQDSTGFADTSLSSVGIFVVPRVIAYGVNTVSVPLIARATSGHATNIFEVQNSATTPLVQVNSAGGLSSTTNVYAGSGMGVGTTSSANLIASTRLTVLPAASSIGIAVKANTTPGRLITYRNSSNSEIGYVDGNATTYAPVFIAGSDNYYTASVSVTPGSTSIIGQVIRGLSGQTANLLELQNNASTPLWALTSAGLPRWTNTANQQTTVGAAGGASALPATPTKYLKVVDSAGTTLVIPAYVP